MNVRLREFHPADANIIAGWLKSEHLMRQWCADRYPRYPVTAEDMKMYYRKFIDGHSSMAFTMVSDEEVVGYVTLRRPSADEAEWRLGFVIVDDSRRGLGLGKMLVGMAVDYACKELGATKISLGVFENNPSAIRCYEAAGFKQVQRESIESYYCLGETWNCIEMELTESHIEHHANRFSCGFRR
ncbi:GNAT family N-acetyltransferase [Prevotella sp. PINT]|jgi:Acetyltransferases, including N-acetylases of ribosomal proteins|uniref:GNAT family N-acetyltransferase n=1 Tax=Palleniella intestinalis TaxID=2736291 RepID=UPI00155581E6|nr:GNAT family protein [Palleniella intestinalis]NPD81816.1 GNAT family N-acetyltransferase [Palleniella intestinalis]